MADAYNQRFCTSVDDALDFIRENFEAAQEAVETQAKDDEVTIQRTQQKLEEAEEALKKSREEVKAEKERGDALQKANKELETRLAALKVAEDMAADWDDAKRVEVFRKVAGLDEFSVEIARRLLEAL